MSVEDIARWMSVTESPQPGSLGRLELLQGHFWASTSIDKSSVDSFCRALASPFSRPNGINPCRRLKCTRCFPHTQAVSFIDWDTHHPRAALHSSRRSVQSFSHSKNIYLCFTRYCPWRTPRRLKQILEVIVYSTGISQPSSCHGIHRNWYNLYLSLKLNGGSLDPYRIWWKKLIFSTYYIIMIWKKIKLLGKALNIELIQKLIQINTNK